MSNNKNYFKSFIYNQGNNSNFKNKSSFTILNETEKFYKEDAVYFADSNNIKNIFIIFAGQQNLSIYADDRADLIYCMKLTGGDRMTFPSSNLWNEKYKVCGYNSFNSAAAKLYDDYHNNSLIIDVLNTKFNIFKDPVLNNHVLKNIFREIFEDIFMKIANRNNIKFFLCGFSRGGLLALKFAELICSNNYGQNINCVATIDPVINYNRESDSILKWYQLDSNTNAWLEHNDKPDNLNSRTDEYFQVIKTMPNVLYYNVFQRNGIITGSAVENAISPINTTWQGKNIMQPADNKPNLDQFDLNAKKHTPDMLDRYWEWILFLADKHCSK